MLEESYLCVIFVSPDKKGIQSVNWWKSVFEIVFLTYEIELTLKQMSSGSLSFS